LQDKGEKSHRSARRYNLIREGDRDRKGGEGRMGDTEAPGAETVQFPEEGKLRVLFAGAGPRPAGEHTSRFFNLSVDLLCIAGVDGYFKMLNDGWERTLGFSKRQMLAKPYLEFVHPDDHQATEAEIQKLYGGSDPLEFENRFRHQDGSYRWLSWTARAFQADQLIYAAARDVTSRKADEQLLAGERRLLEMISTGAPLQNILEEITVLIEELAPGLICSITLRAPDGGHVLHGAGERLPEAYRKAIDGAPLTSGVCSCRTAIASGKQVIAANIATHPDGAGYCEAALRHGLYACWSTPAFSAAGEVLGCFTMYCRAPREPRTAELKLIQRATHLAGIAIERRRHEQELLDLHWKLEARIQERTVELQRANEALQVEIAERRRAEAQIQKHQEAILRLSTPVLKVRDRLLAVPLIGEIDAQRARQLTGQLLAAIRANRALVVVIDMTGVAAVDSYVASHLAKTVQAAGLLGADVIVTGLSREITQTLVALGVELRDMTTLGDLQSGIEEAERRLGLRL
jgi:anti-anti-sigma factor